MTGHEKASAAEIVPAVQEQESIMANLLELYAHDFSEFSELEIGADGRFGYPYLSLYWTEQNRRAYLIKAHGKLAGFVLLRKGSQVSGDQEVWDVAEFFILRGYRRRGLGVIAAHAVWRMFPGKWEVRVMEQNSAARKFWTQAVNDFAGMTVTPLQVEVEGKRWHLLSFQS